WSFLALIDLVFGAKWMTLPRISLEQFNSTL
ncbi:unnamed protein product, partial [Allacma fusca]